MQLQWWLSEESAALCVEEAFLFGVVSLGARPYNLLRTLQGFWVNSRESALCCSGKSICPG